MDINVGFGINDEFAQHCACTMASVLVNSSKEDDYNFYIIYRALSDENMSKIRELKKIRPFNVEFIKIDVSEYSEFSKYSWFNAEQFFRIKFFTLENIDKILYLDSDVIVRKDVRELYSTNLKNYCLAGAKDIVWDTLRKKYNLSEKSIYVNSGVLLINVNKLRTMKFKPKILDFISKYQDELYGDQDIINYIFQEQIAEFDITYNYSYPYVNEYERNYYLSLAADPKIVHYITKTKPWAPNSVCYRKSEYFKYLYYTPYYEDFMVTYKIEENAVLMSKLMGIETMLNNLLSENNMRQMR